MIERLKVSSRLLMGPGPSDVDPKVLQVMSQGLLGHLDPEFLKITDEIQEMLRTVFGTKNRLTFPVSATGSAGMEACILGLIEPGEVFLACENGVFGSRMAEVARRAGAEVISIEKPWGQVFTKEEIESAVSQYNPKVVGLVHAETSTGAHQPMEGIGAAVRSNDGFLVLDCVTSLGGTPVRLDDWQVDAAYSGTQKCLSCPPGLSPVSFSERAVSKIKNRSTKVRSWYLDVSLVENYYGEQRAYHHTAPISMMYALHESLRLVLEEGLEARFARHMRCHKILKTGLEGLGFKYVTDPDHILPQLNAVAVPEGVDEAAIRSSLLKTHGIEIGGGLGAFKGKAWRIGLMGASCSESSVQRLLTALKSLL